MAVRLGAESKPKLFAAIALGVVVLIIAMIQVPKFFGTSTPAPVGPAAPVAAPAATPAATPAAEPSGSSTSASGNGSGSGGRAATAFPHQAILLPSSSALDPTLHPELMAQAEDTTYSGNGRNIFSPDSAAPPVNIEKPKNFRPEPPPPPPGPPPPPAIDLKFYGYSSMQGGNRQIFLLHGDDIFLAHEGDVVDRRYRVVTIRPFSVEIEDIPYHNTQSVPLSQN